MQLYRSAGNLAMVAAGIAGAAFLAQPAADQLAILRTLPIPAPWLPVLTSAVGIAAAEVQRRRQAAPPGRAVARRSALPPALPLDSTREAPMDLKNLSGILSRLINTAVVASTPTAQGGMGIGGSKDQAHVAEAAILWALVEQVLVSHPAAVQATQAAQAPVAVDIGDAAAARAAATAAV